MPALMIAIGKPKDDNGESDSPERQYAKEAYSALRDEDESGFVDAFIAAVQACVKKADDDEYEPDADDEKAPASEG